MFVRSVTLSSSTWGSAIEALRAASHNDLDDAYMGVDQKEAHRAADHMAEQIGYDVACAGCEVEAEMKAEEVGYDDPNAPHKKVAPPCPKCQHPTTSPNTHCENCRYEFCEEVPA